MGTGNHFILLAELSSVILTHFHVSAYCYAPLHYLYSKYAVLEACLDS